MSSPRHATPRHAPPPHAHAIPNPLPAYDQSPVYITQPLAGMCYIVHKSLIRGAGAPNAALSLSDSRSIMPRFVLPPDCLAFTNRDAFLLI